ncbi:hypothetical protein BX600DRAFT_464545 [Xylariales sp. PMI_506]|nr:hypothetical protein BX600DRAFT_464545 [Xylariales sp. PMI_506]
MMSTLNLHQSEHGHLDIPEPAAATPVLVLGTPDPPMEQKHPPVIELPINAPQPVPETETPSLPYSQKRPRNRLPPHWPHLIDIYYSSAHYWFPIIPKQDTLRRAHALCAASAPGSSIASPPSEDLAALWAVMAYASYQEGISKTLIDSHQSEDRIFGLTEEFLQEALALTAGHDATSQVGHVQALLISAVLCLSLGSMARAWLLTGRAVYMAIELGLFRTHHAAAASVVLDDKSERAALGCFVLDTLMAVRLGRRPYLQSVDLYRTSLTTSDGIEEWETWHPQSINGVTYMPSPAKTLSSFAKFVELITVLNDFSRASPSEATDPRLISQTIQRILCQDFKWSSEQSVSSNVPPTPQVLNLNAAAASFCHFLQSKNISSEGDTRSLAYNGASILGLPNTAIRQLQEYHHQYICPLHSIYLNLIPNGFELRNQNQTASHPAIGDAKTIIQYLSSDSLSKIWPRESRGSSVAQNPVMENSVLPGMISPPNGENPNWATSFGTSSNDLYDSLVSLNAGDWSGASRAFLENLGISQDSGLFEGAGLF